YGQAPADLPGDSNPLAVKPTRPRDCSCHAVGPPGGKHFAPLKGGPHMLGRFFDDLPKPHVHLGTFLVRLGLPTIFIINPVLKLAINGDGRGWSHDLLPDATEMAVAWGETIGGFAMLVGFMSRIAAVGLIIIQVGAILLVTGKFDFKHIEFNANDPFRVVTGY